MSSNNLQTPSPPSPPLRGRAAALRLTWFHAVMSQVNRLILRRPDPRELFKGVCEVCVAAGHLDIAVIDLSEGREVHRATAGTMRRAAAESPQSLLDGARMQALMMSLAMRAGNTVVIGDASTDERLHDTRAWCAATGVCALAAVLLKRAEMPIGVLLLHSKTPGYFDGEVTELLGELGADLSFALDNADRERERHEASFADHARKVAEDANRAKTEFLARMSHELRTPLNAMLGFAQLLATDPVELLSPPQAERVRLITHAGWHLLGLVNDVMDISRIEAGRIEVVNVCGDISAVLDEAVALTQPLARTSGLELSEPVASHVGIGAVADPRRLLQVLLNLLSNACKYNRPGGQVRIDVTQAGSEVCLDVVDNGIGMTQEHLNHLFEPFNRLGREDLAVEGSGIGLTLAHQLMRLMNGRLEVESSPESGTRARVVLPSCILAAGKVAAGMPKPAAVASPKGGALVLYIEDEPVNQLLVEQLLTRCEGIQLLQAVNGRDGLALARSRQPDLILLDMQLPDLSGFELLSALRDDPATAALQVVAVSANATPADVAAALDLGALYYWTKPLALEAFRAGLASLLPGAVQPSSDALCGARTS